MHCTWIYMMILKIYKNILNQINQLFNQEFIEKQKR